MWNIKYKTVDLLTVNVKPVIILDCCLEENKEVGKNSLENQTFVLHSIFFFFILFKNADELTIK